MDGSEKQAEMAKAIQAQIRQGATAAGDRAFAVQVFPLRETLSSQSQSTEPTTTINPDGLARRQDLSASNETNDFLTSLYLDTVFPCLFPWYRPQTLAGGRSWLLTVLKTNQAAFHAAISVSAYYFTRLLARDAVNTLRTPCEQHVWDIWASHMDLSMQLIRQHLSDTNTGRGRQQIFDRTHVLDGIVHLLIFEASLAKTGDWNLHSVLLSMQRPSIFDGNYLGYHVWSADQTSFQFSTAVLIYADIIASVCTRRVPELRYCHDALIACSSTPATQSDQRIHMEDYFGSYGWAFILIGDIAALDTRKFAAESYDASNTEELVILGQELETRLYHGLESLGPIPASRKIPGKISQSDQHALVTKLWLHAGLIYLSTVMQRWQPTDPVICTNVHAALELVKDLTSNIEVRCPVWPLCVAGCMVEDGYKLEFRRIMSELPPLQSFGPNKEVVNIVEAAWHRRGQFEGNPPSLVDYFRYRGSTILLI